MGLEGGGAYREFCSRLLVVCPRPTNSFTKSGVEEWETFGDQLSSIWGEACPGGRQLPPIFWQRICRACRLRGQASKGKQGIEKCRKSFKKSTKNDQKWYPGDIWEQPGMISEGNPIFQRITQDFGLPFWSLFGAWGRLFGYLFLNVFWVPSQNDFFAILEPKRPPKWRLLDVNLETFSENAKSVIFETAHAV